MSDLASPELSYSRHASCRARQRGIPQLAVELVQRYGRCEHQGPADVFTLDKRGRAGLRAFLGQLYDDVADFLDIDVVVGESGDVVTVAHLCQRRKRDLTRWGRRRRRV